mgnify:CR=1 FL=1
MECLGALVDDLHDLVDRQQAAGTAISGKGARAVDVLRDDVAAAVLLARVESVTGSQALAVLRDALLQAEAGRATQARLTADLARHAREHGFGARALSPMYLGAGRPGLVIGFSGHAPEILARAARHWLRSINSI